MVISNLTHREEYLKRKRKKRIAYIGIFFLFLIILVVLGSYLSHRKEFRISKVSLAGGVLITQEEVQKRTLDFLSGSYFWLFPKNNAVLYSKSRLEKNLKENFKRIDTINIKLNGFQNLSININERKPQALWCKGEPKDMHDEECYFMDLNSTIFAKAPNFFGDAYFKYYGLISEDNPIGLEYITPSTKFFEITDFVQSVRSLSLKPQYILSKDGGEFLMTLSGGAQIFFDTRESLTKVSANLEALLRTEELLNLDKSNLPVEYLDLRFGNKLYYKLKNANNSAQ